MKRRILCMLICLLAVSVLLVGCGGNGGDTTETTTEHVKVRNEVPAEWVKTTDTIALPKEMFGFAGQPIVIYLRNITNEEPDSVIFCVDAGGKGTLYDNRWEYTPTTAESFKIKIAIVKNTDDTIISNEEFVVTVKDTTQKDNLTMVVIGDSTIYQKHETQTVLDLAVANGYGITLKGTQGAAPNSHEGRSGWTAAYFVEKAERGGKPNELYNQETKKFDFTNYVNNVIKADKVDCVVIQLGINDVKSSTSDASCKVNIRSYLKNMDIIIASIKEYNKDIKIVVNLLLPPSSDEGKFTEYFNGSLTAVRCRKSFYMTNLEILKHFANAENIYISHANVALDAVNNMAAGGTGCIHPAQSGYQQVGTQLYSVLRAIN